MKINNMFEAWRPANVFVDTQAMEVKNIGITIPGDERVKDKELEKKGAPFGPVMLYSNNNNNNNNKGLLTTYLSAVGSSSVN